MEDIMEEDYSKYSVYLQTVQSSAIRTLSEALKEVLIDVNIHFNSTGLRIMSMDGSKIALIYLKLDGNKFEKYWCVGNVQIGVNMLSLFKLLRTIGNTDTVSLYIDKKEKNNLGIRIENKEKAIISDIKLKLLDLDEMILTIPDVDFDSVITMPCVDFQKYCRDLFIISEYVTITSYSDLFCMHSKGDFAENKITIGESEEKNVFINSKDSSDTIVSGEFPLKYLNLFCKSSSLCSNIEIYIKKKYPLVLIYSVASIGSLRFILSPIDSPSD